MEVGQGPNWGCSAERGRKRRDTLLCWYEVLYKDSFILIRKFTEIAGMALLHKLCGHSSTFCNFTRKYFQENNILWNLISILELKGGIRVLKQKGIENYKKWTWLLAKQLHEIESFLTNLIFAQLSDKFKLIMSLEGTFRCSTYPPLDPILSQLDAVHALHPVSFRSVLIFEIWYSYSVDNEIYCLPGCDSL
jgi:hypothetical protein